MGRTFPGKICIDSSLIMGRRWCAGSGEVRPMLKVVHDPAGSNVSDPAAVSSSLLDEIVRDGARQMLAAAMHAEVAAYVAARPPGAR